MAGKMDCFGVTDIGYRREQNQDQFFIAGLNKAMRVHQTSLGIDDGDLLFSESQGTLLLVADGMGGHAGGERASQLVVEGVASYLLDTMPWFFNLDTDGAEEARTSLNDAIIRCQEQLQLDAASHPSVRGMGTTITAAYINWPRATIVHAGDSRCYLKRDSGLSQLTTDHTLAEQFASAGEFRSIDLSKTRWSHVLWNVVGSDADDVEPEVSQLKLEIGDTLLLCTDGLVRYVDNSELEIALNDDRRAEDLCHDLVQRAKDRGGSDNITVVAARFLDVGAAMLAQSAEAKCQADQTVRATADTVPYVQGNSATTPADDGLRARRSGGMIGVR